VEDIYKNLI